MIRGIVLNRFATFSSSCREVSDVIPKLSSTCVAMIEVFTRWSTDKETAGYTGLRHVQFLHMVIHVGYEPVRPALRNTV
jgi:predicted Na+-dependent transporter